MATPVRCPELGESVVEGIVAEWLKKEGEWVNADEPLVMIETDKITMESPSPESGILAEIIAHEGTTVTVRELIGVLIDKGEEYKKGDGLKNFDRGGHGHQETILDAKPIDSITVNVPVEPEKNDIVEHVISETPSDILRLSPAVRRLIAEYNIDPHKIKGTGEGGRIRKLDVEELIADPERLSISKVGVVIEKSAGQSIQPPILKPWTGGKEEFIPLTQIRKTIAKRLQFAKQVAPHTYTFNEVDVTNLIALRESNKSEFEKEFGVKLSYMAIFTKIVTAALRLYPYINATIDDEKITLKHYYNIGIAVDTPRGLVVPNIKDADKKSISQMCIELNDIATRARDNKLTMDDLLHGTFSLTNAGAFGAFLSGPVINVPEAAIMGIHKFQKRPVVNDKGDIVVRDMMNLSISFDHRVVDGVYVERFFAEVMKNIENPARLILSI